MPAAEYALIELFCEEPECDCQRAMLTVVSTKYKNPLAVINFGWKNREFYEKWMGSKEKHLIDDLKGPSLNSLGPQTNLSENILHMVSEIALKDEKYVNRLKEHYRLFKNKINSTSAQESL